MTDTSLRTITLDSERLEAAIGVLSSAAASFRLTRLERFGYGALMVCVDLAIVSLAVVLLVLVTITTGMIDWRGETPWILVGLGSFAFVGSFAGGVIALLINIPLLRRIWRERAWLRSLGVTALAKSLWKASRRGHWLRRIRGALIVVFGGLSALLAVFYLFKADELKEALLLAPFFFAIAAVLLGARLLRNQREQMDLAANAAELQKALQNLREQAGPGGTIAVPAELVERAATIESQQIVMQRKEAIVQSIGNRASGCAITFENKAAEQRAGLDLTERLELEDLLAELSTASGHAVPHQAVSAGGGAASRATAKGEHLELEYAVDQASRIVRITAVRRISNKASHAAAGASHV